MSVMSLSKVWLLLRLFSLNTVAQRHNVGIFCTKL